MYTLPAPAPHPLSAARTWGQRSTCGAREEPSGRSGSWLSWFDHGQTRSNTGQSNAVRRTLSSPQPLGQSLSALHAGATQPMHYVRQAGDRCAHASPSMHVVCESLASCAAQVLVAEGGGTAVLVLLWAWSWVQIKTALPMCNYLKISAAVHRTPKLALSQAAVALRATNFRHSGRGGGGVPSQVSQRTDQAPLQLAVAKK